MAHGPRADKIVKKTTRLKLYPRPNLNHINSHINIAKLVDGPASRNQLAKQKLLCARFLGTFATFTTLYCMLIYRSKLSENELIRIGASGSLTFLACELACFPFDAINF